MLKPKGSRQQTIREKNRALVLESVLGQGLLSRAEVARRLGLTRTTLTNLVSELIRDGILTEAIPAEGGNGPGRKSIDLELSPDAPLICGVLIQRGNLRVILSNLKGELRADTRYSYTGLISQEEFSIQMKQLWQTLLQKALDHPILAVGISCAGPLDIVAGKMLNPHHFFTQPCDFAITDFWKNLTGLPVYLCHDAAAGAVAEKLFGRGRGEENFLYISTFNGIGAGFYLENKLYNGGMGQNGELGHMSIHFDGPKCVCGSRGCLEVYANIPDIVHGYIHFSEFLPDHPLLKNPSPTILDVLQLIDEGDILAMAVLTEYCRYLAAAVASLITQLGMDLVILSGSGKEKSKFFEHTLRHLINERTCLAGYREIRVETSDFGLDSPLYGSAGIVIDRIFRAELDPVSVRQPDHRKES